MIRLAAGVDDIPHGTFVKVGCFGWAEACLHRDVMQSVHQLHNGLNPRLLNVRNVVLLAVRLEELARFPQAVARKTRPNVVFDLKLQTSVKPVLPCRAQNVLRCSDLGDEPRIPVVVVWQSVDAYTQQTNTVETCNDEMMLCCCGDEHAVLRIQTAGTK